jgi:hypothetical protein
MGRELDRLEGVPLERTVHPQSHRQARLFHQLHQRRAIVEPVRPSVGERHEVPWREKDKLVEVHGQRATDEEACARSGLELCTRVVLTQGRADDRTEEIGVLLDLLDDRPGLEN